MLLYEHAQKIVDEDKPVAGLFLGTGSTKTRISLFLARGATLVICHSAGYITLTPEELHTFTDREEPRRSNLYNLFIGLFKKEESQPCYRHYFSSKDFTNCPECGWSSKGMV